MRFVGNLLWFVFFGWYSALLWCLLGIVLAITVIGIPFALSAFRIAVFAAFPYGKELVDARLLGEQRVVGTGVANFIWIVIAGFWLAVAHGVLGIVCFLSIIFIPGGFAHFNLAQAAFAPLGKRIVSKEMAKKVKEKALENQLKEVEMKMATS